MSKWKLKNKVVFLSSILILAFAGTVFFSMKGIMSDSFNRITKTTHDNYLEVKREYLKDLVLMAYQIAYKHYQEDPSDKSKELVKKLLTNLKYQNGLGYFFAYEKRGDAYYMVFHGADQSRVGTRTDTEVDFRKKLVDKANEGGGFVEYHYQKPDQNNKERKIAYAYPFTAWNWIIMAGLYVDDVENSINEMIVHDQEEKKNLTYTFLVITLLLLVFSILFITLFIGRSVENIVEKLFYETKNLTDAAEKGHLKMRGNEENVHGEFQTVVSGVNKMLDSFLKPVDSAIQVLRKVENADLSSKMEGEYKGDYALLQKTLNQTLDSMSDLLFQAKIIVNQLSSGAQDVVKSGHFLCESSLTLKKVLKDFDTSVIDITDGVNSLENEIKKHFGSEHESLFLIKKINNQVKHLKAPLSTLDTVGERGILSAEKYSEMADILADQAKQLSLVIGKFKLD